MKKTLAIAGQTVAEAYDVEGLFCALTHNGCDAGSLLYESQDEHGKFTGLSIGIFAPSLKVSGKKNHFVINARDTLGKQLLPIVARGLPNQVSDLLVTEEKIMISPY